jgi:hypothetical protein
LSLCLFLRSGRLRRPAARRNRGFAAIHPDSRSFRSSPFPRFTVC